MTVWSEYSVMENIRGAGTSGLGLPSPGPAQPGPGHAQPGPVLPGPGPVQPLLTGSRTCSTGFSGPVIRKQDFGV